MSISCIIKWPILHPFYIHSWYSNFCHIQGTVPLIIWLITDWSSDWSLIIWKTAHCLPQCHIIYQLSINVPNNSATVFCTKWEGLSPNSRRYQSNLRLPFIANYKKSFSSMAEERIDLAFRDFIYCREFHT